MLETIEPAIIKHLDIKNDFLTDSDDPDRFKAVSEMPKI